MRKFAAFIVSGYGQAVACTAGLAWFAAFVPITGMLSAAALALTALQWGPQRAGIVLVLSTAALFGFFALASVLGLAVAGYESVFLFALLQWLPLAVLAQLLRVTRSLSFTLNLLLITGLAAVGLVALLVPDAAGFWDRFFNWALHGAVQLREADDVEFSEQYRAFLEVMTGVAAASLVLVWSVSLLLARWWQYLLGAPGDEANGKAGGGAGSFRSEFTALKLGRIIAGAGLALFAAMSFSGAYLLRELVIVMMSVFLLQGIATVHGLLYPLKNAGLWLFVFYAGLALSPVFPQLPGLLGVAGALENFVGLRERLQARNENRTRDRGE